MTHGYPFDPSHGYTLERLLRVEAPMQPEGFDALWEGRRADASKVKPRPRITDTGITKAGWRIHDLSFVSTDNLPIGGWALVPVSGRVTRGFVVGHGYGGRDAPDFDLPVEDAVIFFPCARGLSRSRRLGVSPESQWHVLHNIQSRENYILGGCVEDLWVCISALHELFPETVSHTGYIGVSFGGGIGALALAWEDRVSRAHLIVPSFGHQPLRMHLASIGSAASVQIAVRRRPALIGKLAFYDAATAARHIRIPVLCACAMFDPAVAPAGQFAIYNALSGPKSLFVLTAGHHDYPTAQSEGARLQQEVHKFFRDM